MSTYLNTPPIFSQKPSQVDRENGIISDIVVTSTGEAKGHNLHLNNKFLDDVVSLAAEHSVGIKARFGHPNICTTALGTYLGRFKNFRLAPVPPQGGSRGVNPSGGCRRRGVNPSGEMPQAEGSVPPQGGLRGVNSSGGTKGGKEIPAAQKGKEGCVLADLHLDPSSKKSPNGNLYEYVLDMAENNPDMFGASIAFKRGEDKTELSEINGKSVKKTFASIKALYATDLVDSPAATDGLFEVFHEDELAFQVTTFLDEHPQVFKLLDKKPHILTEFLDKYKTHKTMNFKDEIEKLKNWAKVNILAQMNPEGFDISEADKSITNLNDLNEAFDDKIASLEQKYVSDEMASMQDQLNTSLDNISVLEQEKSNLQATLDNHASIIDEQKAELKENADLLISQTELQSQFDKLTSQFNQLKATKSGNTIGADPAVSLNKEKKTDKNGMLYHMPIQLRKQLNKVN